MVFGADKRLVPASDTGLPEYYNNQAASGGPRATQNSYGQMVNNPQQMGVTASGQSEFDNQSQGIPGTGHVGSERSANVLQAAHQIEQGKS